MVTVWASLRRYGMGYYTTAINRLLGVHVLQYNITSDNSVTCRKGLGAARFALSVKFFLSL